MIFLIDSVINYRLRDGDCVVFDNLRVLHGRTGFTLDMSNVRTDDFVGRHLQGINKHQIHSVGNNPPSAVFRSEECCKHVNCNQFPMKLVKTLKSLLKLFTF